LHDSSHVVMGKNMETSVPGQCSLNPWGFMYNFVNSKKLFTISNN
jgi:hypothetical protein